MTLSSTQTAAPGDDRSPSTRRIKNLLMVFIGSDAMLGAVVESVKIATGVPSTFLLCSGAIAIGADSGNPYQGIVDRNVFGLKPPPPPGKPEEKKVDLPPITLTGITTILGNKRALMNVQSPGKTAQS